MALLNKFLKKTDFNSYEDFVSNYKVIVPENFNFAYDVVDYLAEKTPNERALVWCDEHGNEATFSYKEIKDYSDKAASVLYQLGIKKGDKVMLILKRRFEFWFILVALHKLGAVAIPATHLLTAKDIIYRCNAADIKMVIAIAENSVLQHVEDAVSKSPTLKIKAFVKGINPESNTIPYKDWIDFDKKMKHAKKNNDIKNNTKIDDTMLLYFTSGTTGMPKMVRHNFAYPLGHILTAKYWQQVKEKGLHLTVADTGWAKAAWGKIYGQWICECAVFVYDYDRFNPQEMLKVIEKYKLTSFCAPPTVYRFFIKEDLTKYDFSNLEHCSVAGEPLNPEVFDQFKKMTSLELQEGYGQTELTITVATFPWLKPKPGSMGKPAPSYDIVLLDENLKPCALGDVGQIVIQTKRQKPVGMFIDYYRDEELTKKVWHDNLYFTGDMAWQDEDGYLWFVGRSDDVIKSSGYRIGPFEVESALLEHPAVLECAVTGVPDPDRGQAVKATIVLAKGWTQDEALKTELQEHVKKVTAPYKYPRIIEFVTELPKTISGKIRRVQIRDKDKEIQ